MSFFHGARASVKTDQTNSAQAVTSGVVVVVGTAPVNQVATADKVVLAKTFDEAVAAYGYSDNWGKYTLCEAMYTYFKKYGVGPVLMINVADPAENKESVDAETVSVVDKRAEITEDAILGSIVVKSGDTAMTSGTDYEAYYEDGKCVIAAISGGGMESAASITVSYDKFSFELDDMTEKVIGSYDVDTGETTGLELIHDCFALYQVNPDLIIAPGFSHKAEVAMAMNEKTSVNTLFRARALIDADAESNVVHSTVPTWKKNNGIVEGTELIFWPMATMEGKVCHLSTHAAALMAKTDAGNENCPSESPSNKQLMIDGTCLKDGTEVTINLEKANYLNANGIITALNFVGGYRLWGNHTACYPEETAAVLSVIPVARMYDWITNNLVLAYWDQIDSKLTRRLCETIADNATIWMNGLTASGHLYGGRVEFLAEENKEEDILNGILHMHVYMAAPRPVQEIDFVVEYDASMMVAALSN